MIFMVALHISGQVVYIYFLLYLILLCTFHDYVGVLCVMMMFLHRTEPSFLLVPSQLALRQVSILILVLVFIQASLQELVQKVHLPYQNRSQIDSEELVRGDIQSLFQEFDISLVFVFFLQKVCHSECYLSFFFFRIFLLCSIF